MGIPKEVICHDLPRKTMAATVDSEPHHIENNKVTRRPGNSADTDRSLIDIYNNISSLKDEFYRDIMPDTRRKIAELIAEADPDFKRKARIECLKGFIEDLVFGGLYSLQRFERYLHNGKTLETILEKEGLDELIKKILKAQAEIILLRKPEKPGEITDDMIRRAREYPFADLYEFERNQAVCPFHADKNPSMHLFRDNHVYCFSCGKGWDTIGFIMERDGLSFPETVKKLQ